MDEKEQRIFALLESYELGVASTQEVRDLELWYQTFESKPDIMANLTDEEKIGAMENMLARISAVVPDHQKGQLVAVKKSVLIWQRWMVAASILFILSFGSYLILHKAEPKEQFVKISTGDFAPGSNKAVLTLAGGRQIMLSDAKNGQLATQGGAVIQKTAEGEVVYGSAGASQVMVMNTMATPRGGEFHLILADGTGVWLNAASSITYPSSFVGGQRQVKISGEVYFEVAHDASKPFLVESRGQRIEVLGTHFNVNAYDDEKSTKTTLLEGSVRISTSRNVAILKPGQQSMVGFDDESITLRPSDSESDIAWKNGLFIYKKTKLEDVMKQFSRWYDVEVIYQGKIPDIELTGDLHRNANARQLLEILRNLGVNFKSDGNTITIKGN